MTEHNPTRAGWDEQIEQLQHSAQSAERRAQVFDRLHAARLADHTRALAAEDTRLAQRLQHYRNRREPVTEEMLWADEPTLER